MGGIGEGAKPRAAQPNSSITLHGGVRRKRQPSSYSLPIGRQFLTSICTQGTLSGALDVRTLITVPSEMAFGTDRHRPPVERSTTQPCVGSEVFSALVMRM